MTNEQLQILQHALGADQYGQWPKGNEWYYRDYFIGEDPICEDLVALGHMNKFPGNAATGGDPCYRVTGNGIVAMRQSSPRAPRLTRSQKRYRDFLDSDTGMKFGEWIKRRA